MWKSLEKRKEYINEWQLRPENRVKINARRRETYKKEDIKVRRARRRKEAGLPEPTRKEPNKCECCGKEVTTTALCLDHCHKTGKFRGWLCWNCNTGLGHLGDNTEGLLRGLKYLIMAKENE